MGLSQVDTHFLKMATAQTQVAAQGESHNRKRGAILAKNNELVARGISQHLGGDLFKPNDDERYVATVNAELVAIGDAVKANIGLGDCTLYCTDCPNWYTYKMIVELGIKRIVFYGPVSNERISHYSSELGIEIIPI